MAAPRPDVPALHDRALQDLSFIRRTMEGAASFTDVPGWGLVATGILALPAALIASRQPTPERWLATWIATASVAGLASGAAMVAKMRRRAAATGARLLSGPARKFLLGFWPALLSGAVLTFALAWPFATALTPRVTIHLLPGLWLLLYGVAVTTAGASSVRAVPLMGLGFMGLGAITLLLPAARGDVMMALGFGGLQIGCGVHIARRHGG